MDCRQKARKLFVIKILTSNPWRLKILQTIFANPAPSKTFRGGGGGGIPDRPDFPETKLPKIQFFQRFTNLFLIFRTPTTHQPLIALQPLPVARPYLPSR